jgi:hypothetical protein
VVSNERLKLSMTYILPERAEVSGNVFCLFILLSFEI